MTTPVTPSLLDVARAEHAARVAAEQAAADAARTKARDDLQAAVRAAVIAALAKSDGTRLTWPQTGLKLGTLDVDRQRVAVEGPAGVTLLVRKQPDGDWVVHTGTVDGTVWVEKDRIRSLADLGRAYPAAG